MFPNFFGANRTQNNAQNRRTHSEPSEYNGYTDFNETSSTAMASRANTQSNADAMRMASAPPEYLLSATYAPEDSQQGRVPMAQVVSAWPEATQPGYVSAEQEIAVSAPVLSINNDTQRRDIHHSGPIDVTDSKINRIESTMGDISIVSSVVKRSVIAQQGSISVRDAESLGSLEARVSAAEPVAIKVEDANVTGSIMAHSSDVQLHLVTANGHSITAENGRVFLHDVDKIGDVEAGCHEPQTGPTVSAIDAEISGSITAHQGDVQLSKVTAKQSVVANNGNIRCDYVNVGYEDVAGSSEPVRVGTGRVQALTGNVSIFNDCRVGDVQCGGLAMLGSLGPHMPGVTAQSVKASWAKLNSVEIKNDLTVTATDTSEPLSVNNAVIKRIVWQPDTSNTAVPFAASLKSTGLSDPQMVVQLNGMSHVDTVEFPFSTPGIVSLEAGSSVDDVVNGEVVYQAQLA